MAFNIQPYFKNSLKVTFFYSLDKNEWLEVWFEIVGFTRFLMIV